MINIDIVLNEKKYAEKILETHQFNETDFPIELSFLIRYLYHHKELKRAGILKFLSEFMPETNITYSEDTWIVYIDKCINKAKKRPPVEIDCIPISKIELEAIHAIQDNPKERLLFTLLVLAKYNNLKSGREHNNDWVNFDEKTIFKLARVACSMRDRDKMIYELKEAGFITNSKKITSLNIKVNLIDESETVLKITDMRELGFQYQETFPNNLIRRCSNCGKPYKLKKKTDRAGLCPLCKEPNVKIVNGQRIKICQVCGREFKCDPSDKRSYLCPEHQEEMTRKKTAERVQTYRKSNM